MPRFAPAAPFYLILTLSLALVASVAAPAQARTHALTEVPFHPLTGAAVLDAFHGEAGVRRVATAMVDRAAADPRIGDIFKGHDLNNSKQKIGDLFCWLLGGPSVYGGRSMVETHKAMGLQPSDLTALVEDLQSAMDAEGVPFPAQNQLLALIAPQKRAVVER